MSPTLRALLCAAACFLLGYLFFRLSACCNKQDGWLAEMYALVAMTFAGFGLAALVSVGLETGFIAQTYRLACTSPRYMLTALAVLALLTHLAFRNTPHPDNSLKKEETLT